MSAKLRYGILLDKSEYMDIKCISWKFRMSSSDGRSQHNCFPFIGVVSNRTTDFDRNPYNFNEGELIDAYGVSARKECVYKFNYNWNCYRSEQKDKSYPGFQKESWITVKYMIHEARLVFENLTNGKSYSIQLPTYIGGITEWYPAVTLRFEGDECEIKDAMVE